MDYQVRESKLSKMSARLNLMVVLVMGLMLSNVILASLAHYSLKHQKREIVPFGHTTGYVISDVSVDAHYLSLMSELFIYTRLNITPQNVSKNHLKLLYYVDASFYPAFKKRLGEEELLIKDKKISSSFEIIDVKPDPEHLTSKITGNLKRYVGYRELKAVEKSYHIQYQYRAGKLSIVGFVEEQGVHDE